MTIAIECELNAKRKAVNSYQDFHWDQQGLKNRVDQAVQEARAIHWIQNLQEGHEDLKQRVVV